jgi:hypothetical protein
MAIRIVSRYTLFVTGADLKGIAFISSQVAHLPYHGMPNHTTFKQ